MTWAAECGSEEGQPSIKSSLAMLLLCWLRPRASAPTQTLHLSGVAALNLVATSWVETQGGRACSSQPHIRKLASNQVSPCSCYVGVGRSDPNIAFERRGNIKSCGSRLGRAQSWVCPLKPTTHPNSSIKSSLAMLPLCWLRQWASAPTQTLHLSGVAALNLVATSWVEPQGGRESGMCPLKPTTHPDTSIESSLVILLLCWLRPFRPKHCI